MKKISAIITGSLAVFAVPFVSFAQVVTDLTGVGGWIINLINNVLVPVLFAVAFIVFIWGAFTTFILGANDDDVKTKGKNLMLWGLIGFFVMVSIWGLVNILTGSIQFGQTVGPTTVPGAGVQVR